MHASLQPREVTVYTYLHLPREFKRIHNFFQLRTAQKGSTGRAFPLTNLFLIIIRVEDILVPIADVLRFYWLLFD